MSYLTVNIDQPDSIVSVDGDAIRVDPKGKQFKRIPLNAIGRIIIERNPLIEKNVFAILAEHNIPVLMTHYGKKGKASVTGGTNAWPGLFVRKFQILTALNHEASLIISKWLLSEKLRGQISVIQKISNGEAILACEKINQYKKELESADSQDSLMGIEGTASSFYFKTLSNYIPEKWEFFDRNRRPPKDPVNALLSLSYVMATSQVRYAAQVRGLDPMFSFLHAMQEGRENILYDIIEPIRPVIDQFVLYLIEKRLCVNDFGYGENDSCRLNKAGRGVYYGSWAKWQNSENHKPVKLIARDIIENIVQLFPGYKDEESTHFVRSGSYDKFLEF